MSVRQLPASPITCVRVTTTGETAITTCASLRIFSTSSTERFGNACAP
jgi:hypothetical protein